MCQSSQQQYASVTGMVNVTTANTSLTGSGNLNMLITASTTTNGTIIKTITIKAAASNAQGMLRIFITNTSSVSFLWKEIPVPANVQSATVAAYQTTIRASYILEPGFSMQVTSQNAENWNFIAEGVNWTNCACSD